MHATVGLGPGRQPSSQGKLRQATLGFPIVPAAFSCSVLQLTPCSGAQEQPAVFSAHCIITEPVKDTVLTAPYGPDKRLGKYSGVQHALLAGGGVVPALSPSSSAPARERFGTRCLAYAVPSMAPRRALSTSGSGAGEALMRDMAPAAHNILNSCSATHAI